MLHTRTVFIPLVDETLRSSPLVFTPRFLIHNLKKRLFPFLKYTKYSQFWEFLTQQRLDYCLKMVLRARLINNYLQNDHSKTCFFLFLILKIEIFCIFLKIGEQIILVKKLSLCQKPYIFATQCRRPEIFQTWNSVDKKI